eukprot:2976816-Prymnesium_polylepis.2
MYRPTCVCRLCLVKSQEWTLSGAWRFLSDRIWIGGARQRMRSDIDVLFKACANLSVCSIIAVTCVHTQLTRAHSRAGRRRRDLQHGTCMVGYVSAVRPEWVGRSNITN